MPFFTTPISQLAATDLQELLNERYVENVRLEFKSKVPDKNETLKKLSSFANTFGGFLVVGASANSSDGRLDSLPGVDEEAGYKQKVVQWCFDSISPPLVVEVSDPIPVADSEGKFCYVIFVPESEIAPHFMNGRKGVWVRSDEFSQRYSPELANDNEIRHLLDRRLLITQRRNEMLKRSGARFEQYVLIKSTDESRRSGRTVLIEAFKNFPRLEVSIGPRFPARPAWISLCAPGMHLTTGLLRNPRTSQVGPIWRRRFRNRLH